MKRSLLLFSALVLLAGCATTLPDLAGPRGGQWRETRSLDMNIIVGAVEKFRALTGEFPARLEQLITGPQNWPDAWSPLLPESVSLEDPWGYPYQLQAFDGSRALLTGLDFQIVCAGPDHAFATADDFALPEPNALYTPGLSLPGPPPSLAE